MLINTWKMSTERLKVFEAGLQQLVLSGRIRAGLTVDPNPLPVYAFALPQISESPANLSAITPISWRYFAGSAGEAVVGEVSATSPPKLTGISFGPQASDALETTLRIEKRFENVPDAFQLSFLRIPGMLTEAFWLKPPTTALSGLIVPFHTMIKSFDRSKALDISEFFVEVTRLGDRVRQFDDSPSRSKSNH